MAINGKYNVEERNLKRQIQTWKNKQIVLSILNEWLLLDIKINALENKIKDLVLIKMVINGKYNVEERNLKRQIQTWKNKQIVLSILNELLLLDIKINALENKIKDSVLNRTNNKKKKNL